MKTLVINLERAVERKKHMMEQLNNFPFLDVEFISAVDGRQLSLDRANLLFDQSSFYELYNRKPLLGEIGCTLSHIKCYQKLIDSNERAVLILEDDTFLSSSLNLLNDMEIEDKPQLILLTPRFSYSYKVKDIGDGFSLNKVFFGSCSAGYIINREAAKIICKLAKRPYWVADDWLLMKRHMILQGIVPAMIRWDENLATQIQMGDDKHSKFCYINLIFSPLALCHKFLKLIGHYSM